MFEVCSIRVVIVIIIIIAIIIIIIIIIITIIIIIIIIIATIYKQLKLKLGVCGMVPKLFTYSNTSNL